MIIDQIRKRFLVSTPETVNTDWATPSTSLDDRTGAFSLSLKYDNGTGVNMKVYIQLSNDDIDFGDVEDSEVIITDPSGSIIFDMEGSGAQYARIRVAVTAGSIDVLEAKYVGSQFH
jgi:hypothetical protein